MAHNRHFWIAIESILTTIKILCMYIYIYNLEIMLLSQSSMIGQVSQSTEVS